MAAEQEQQIFERALRREPESRRGFLDEACGGDAALRARIEAMIAGHDEAPTQAVPPGGGGESAEEPPVVDPLLGKQVGHYTVKRLIGAGGMGRVYEAVQEHPRRRVALKVMRPGVASRSVLRRFEYESQILARLRHPGIAQIYEAGTHDSGEGAVPYFAMEYVPGARPVTDHAELKKLDIRERLRIFVEVCDAVHHGHQKGIIHRDLKPANILVDPAGEPKIIDFGIARATDADITVTSLQTQLGEIVGTLQYMSPEQCDADPHALDTRSDVYALGVVLYELITGELPYDLSKVPIHQAARVIKEDAPTKPGTVDRMLRGDLQTIMLTALQKEPSRRYQDARSLAEDIRRYLDNRPIRARPPSILYHTRMFARRNKAVCAAILVVFAVLVTATIVGFTLAVQAAADRDRAELEAGKSREARRFVSDVLSDLFLREREGGTVSVRDVVVTAAARTESSEGLDDPRQRAAACDMLGSIMWSLGMVEEAEPYLEQAVTLRLRDPGASAEELLGAELAWAGALHRLRRYRAAERTYRSAVARARTLHGVSSDDVGRILEQLARVLIDDGRQAEAKEYVQRALAILGPGHPRRSNALTTLATVHQDLGEHEEARRRFAEALELRQAMFGRQSALTISAINNLATFLLLVGQLQEAERQFRTGYDRARASLPESNWLVYGLQSGLGACLARRGRYEEAETHLAESFATLEVLLGLEDPRTVRAAGHLVALYEASSRPEDARALRERLPVQEPVRADD